MPRSVPASGLSPDRNRARVRVPVTRLASGDHSLGPQIARYLGAVHRLKAGDAFEAFDPDLGLEADGEVLEVTATELVARVGVLVPARVVQAREVRWLQALPKGDKMDGIVRDATELGATHVVPVTSEFTVVKLDARGREAKRQRWERVAREAARQCGRGDAPQVLAVRPWAEALAEAASPSAAPRSAFCLYEQATAPLGPALLAAGSSGVAFAAGPEGGLSVAEVETAFRYGFAPVSLGKRILRAETVVAATLGALNVLEGLRGSDGEEA